jgi:hypothetical protein
MDWSVWALVGAAGFAVLIALYRLREKASQQRTNAGGTSEEESVGRYGR